jgi:hypothetical protein
MEQIIVIKLDYAGRETYRYSGWLIEAKNHVITVEAFFDRLDTRVDDIVLLKGDRFVEYYFNNRWYNILEVHDRSSDHVKCWYCNISYPAILIDNSLSYRDLALDLLVYPDGRQVILDRDEFEKLPLQSEITDNALKGLNELQENLKRDRSPSISFSSLI